jgi:16S rRNA (guanine(966)-N(2))-methyltransferase RsmD
VRIISGKYKGRKIEPPGRLPVRPTTDFAKEGLFNVLTNMVDFEGMEVLDLFAGSGSISFEFISRGCASVFAVEQHYAAVKFINEMAAKLGEKNVKAQNADVFRYLGFSNRPFDLVFADPPFDLDNAKLLPGIIFERKLLKEDGMLIIEHPERLDYSTLPGYSQTRKYGKVNFSFFINQL